MDGGGTRRISRRKTHNEGTLDVVEDNRGCYKSEESDRTLRSTSRLNEREEKRGDEEPDKPLKWPGL